MTVSVISRKDAVSTTWSGGTTTEFYLFPRDGSYKERRFDLRISSATVDLEASDFTLLPDYQRIITPLEGGFTLTYKETGEKVTLAPLEEDFLMEPTIPIPSEKPLISMSCIKKACMPPIASSMRQKIWSCRFPLSLRSLYRRKGPHGKYPE